MKRSHPRCAHSDGPGSLQEKKFLFELREKQMQTVAEMIEIKESDADILQLRHADVLFDGKKTRHETASCHWLHSKVCSSEARQILWEKSLFGGLENHNERGRIMSLDAILGAFNCWDKELFRAGDEIYTHVFGDTLNSLKYEKDHVWVSRMPLNPLPFNLQEVDEEHPTDLQ